MAEVRNSMTASPIKWAIAGLALVTLTICVTVSVYLHLSELQFQRNLATLVATNPNIASFGDGVPDVVVSRGEVAAVGDTVEVADYQVTVMRSYEITDAAPTVGAPNGWQTWSIEYEVMNTGQVDLVAYQLTNTKIQFDLNGKLAEAPDAQTQCDPTIDDSLQALAPDVKIRCEATFWMPAEGQKVYWVFVYGRLDEYVAFRVR